MSGHSKWSQIKHQKSITDAKKAQVFSKLSKAISLAARENSDPSANPHLSAVIEQARTMNMPKDNIERAIKRVSDKQQASLDEIIIQAMGPLSVALIIHCITDNRNRTINEIKNILAKNEAKMVGENSLNWMFDRNWNAYAPLEISDQENKNKIGKLMEELDNQDDVEDIYSNLKDLS